MKQDLRNVRHRDIVPRQNASYFDLKSPNVENTVYSVTVSVLLEWGHTSSYDLSWQ